MLHGKCLHVSPALIYPDWSFTKEEVAPQFVSFLKAESAQGFARDLPTDDETTWFQQTEASGWPRTALVARTWPSEPLGWDDYSDLTFSLDARSAFASR